jgi:membrane-bound serine protease (ClpP class)
MTLCGIALASDKESEIDVEVRATKLKGYDPHGGDGRKLFEVPIEGTIDLGLAPFVERVVEEAGKNDIVFLRMNTFGGRVDAAVRIRDALLNAHASTVIYIGGRAISAGALIALACDTIIMSPGATIGDAMPIRLGGDGESKPTSEKAISYMREEMAATAQAKGRRADIARAMVDPDIELKGIVGKDKLLTLTADRALELGIADALQKNFDSAVALLNLQKAERIEMRTHWAETIARILTDPIVSSLLMTFGALGLLMEFYTPGFGWAGGVGLACLAMFFLGQYAAHLAGWEELLLLAVGLVLLALEVFVIPGFGIAGVAGMACIAAAIVMALVELELPLDVSLDLGYLQEAASIAAVRIAILMVVATGATVLFGKYFPQTRFAKRIILGSATAAKDGYVSQAASMETLLGKRGTTVGVLRPAGIAEIEGKRVDVVTEGSYVKKGVEVEVVQVDGNRVVVKRIT